MFVVAYNQDDTPHSSKLKSKFIWIFAAVGNVIEICAVAI
jgi:hypothetical protein